MFFSVTRQELYLFNAAATLVWCCLEDGMSIDRIVAQYTKTFETGTELAALEVGAVLDCWRTLGYINCQRPDDGPEIPFVTALGRLLVNESLRRMFAESPWDAAEELRVVPEDRESFIALDPGELEREAARLSRQNLRRNRAPLDGDTLFSGTTSSGLTIVESVANARWARLGMSALERHYAMLTTRFTLRYSTDAELDCVHPALAHLEVPPARVPCEITYDVIEADDGHAVLNRTLPVGWVASIEQLTPFMKSLISRTALNRHRYFLQLHAGVVSDGTSCLILAGAPGSGKTTLTAGLVYAGFQYFSDEVGLLEEATLDLRPFPLGLGIKPGAVEILSGAFPQLAEMPAHSREDGKRVRYLSLSRERCAPFDTTRPARWLIFPRYDPHGGTALTPIANSEALRELMHECMVLPDLLDEPRVRRFVQWIRTLECFRLQVSSLDEAVRLLVRLCKPDRLDHSAIKSGSAGD